MFTKSKRNTPPVTLAIIQPLNQSGLEESSPGRKRMGCEAKIQYMLPQLKMRITLNSQCILYLLLRAPLSNLKFIHAMLRLKIF
jgi:hypothetical protein